MSRTEHDDTSLDLLTSPFLHDTTPPKAERASLIPTGAGAHLGRPLGHTVEPGSPVPAVAAGPVAPTQGWAVAADAFPPQEQAVPAQRAHTDEAAFWTIVEELRTTAASRYADELAGREGLSDVERQSMGWKHIDAVIAEKMRELMQLRGADGALTADEQQALRQAVHDSMFGLGRFQPLIDEPDVENVHINGCDRVFVEKAGGVMEARPPVAESDEQLMADLQFLAAHAGEESRPFSAAHPDLDMDLRGSVRLAATAPPVSKRPTVVLRVHRFLNITLEQMVASGTMSPLAAEFLTALVKAQKTIVISGFGGDGKTTLMRALAGKIGRHEQVVTIEKERELHLDRLDALEVPPIELQYRPGSGERHADGTKVGEYTLSQAMEKALRLNSRRILVGEVRGSEITAMIQAMQTGAGTFCTVHSYSAEEAVRRLVGLGMSHYSEAFMSRQLSHHLDVVVQMRKVQDTEGKTRRKILSIAEVMPGDNTEGISVADLFRLDPGEEHAHAVQPPSDERLRADLEAVGFDLGKMAGTGR